MHYKNVNVKLTLENQSDIFKILKVTVLFLQ